MQMNAPEKMAWIFSEIEDPRVERSRAYLLTDILLFEYLVENLGESAQPRKSRKSSKPKTFTLPNVPS